MSRKIDELHARVAKLERMVDFLLDHLQLDYQDSDYKQHSGASMEVMDLVLRGKKIQAIKQYRRETGAGLKEAKDFIDSIGV